ncbi:MAG: hypothetical protein A2527_10765 [Candidatus Lambdaproteobacteria bacterium RIFOXYD2_FULL_50_16]|uniref:16S rRNA (Guanine(966)-N(2))-methyltransferase RsmD n=1 Tax=Candidatus Lambdaproteobacteria bacterium RIFOXYD2_FULL_50_16 TaxID=1817772 RepID=A0A1F6GGA3_9PROT|nr:MAG: hypothetical protein A2527_10765 [Candidatus Lambdaproteobacteria bacterium RIFOXYD2_FULL_50_16]
MAGLRIVSGRLKGRRIPSPEGLGARPSLEKNRIVLFEVLAARYRLSDFQGVDLFAGSGALGAEAYSRGAEPVTFVENHKERALALQKNLGPLFGPDSFFLFKGDGLDWLKAQKLGGKPCLFLLDPPWGQGLGERALAFLGQNQDRWPGSLVVLEESADRPVFEGPGLTCFMVKKLGRARLDFFTLNP